MKTFNEIIEETKGILALLCEKDKEALFRYAQEVPENGVIVDIGTAGGGSAVIMALASKPSVKVFTIDPNENKRFMDSKSKLNLDDKITYFHMTSKVAFETWDKDIDLLFIDGVHNYDGVMDDFKTFGNRVKKDGIIAFHDVLLYDNTIGIAVEKLIEDGQIKEIERVIDTYQQDPRKIGVAICKKL